VFRHCLAPLALTIATMPARTASGSASERWTISAKSADFWAKSAKQDAKSSGQRKGKQRDDSRDALEAMPGG
jgi:hypothetical protein